MATTERVSSPPPRDRVIARVADEVEAEVAVHAAASSASHPARVGAVAGKLRKHALADVARTDRELRVGRVATRVAQVMDYLFDLIYGLLGLRFVLAAVGARSGAGFTRLIHALSDPFYGPFRNIVETIRFGDGQIVVSLGIAFIAYAALHLAIRGLLKLAASRRAEL